MAFVLIHIAHEGGSVDVAVPDDEPVDALLPQVLAAADAPAGERRPWALLTQDRRTLVGNVTLRAAAVDSGSTLQLVAGPSTRHSTLPAAPPVPPVAADNGRNRQDAPAVQLPLERTRAVLPQRRSFAPRLGLTIAAALRAGSLEQVTLARDLDTGPSPAALTRTHRSGPLARARRTWRGSNYAAALDDIIVRPRLLRCATIAVVSPKGGVGKTTITTLLGTLLAQLRRDRIVAIDTNPDYGSLGRTLAPQHNVFVDDLLEVLDHPVLTVTQLDTSLARAQHGLLVLPAPTAPERMARLDEEAYSRVIGRLQRMVGVIVLDCGTGLWEPAARAALKAADQVILVSDAEPATASLVAEASLQLQPANVPVTLVVNKMSPNGRLDVDRFARAIAWAQGLITIADERAAATSIATGDFTWDEAPRSWRTSARELGAVVAADWERLGLTL